MRPTQPLRLLALASFLATSSLFGCGEEDDFDADEFAEDEDIHFRPAQPGCPSCRFKTATYTISSSQMQGGTINTAKMNTHVTHTTCPYSGYGSPCTMDMSFSVKCLTSGAGTFQVQYSPNGYSTGASGSGTVDVLVNLPGGGTTSFSVNATIATPDTTVAPATPCGDTPWWQIH